MRFAVAGPLRPVVFCHCSQCRRQTGLHYAATEAADADLTITGETLRWYHASPDAGRGFCSTCGSALFWKREGSASTSIMAGALDQPSGLEAARHIYVADKPDFYEICDGLPQFEHRADVAAPLGSPPAILPEG